MSIEMRFEIKQLGPGDTKVLERIADNVFDGTVQPILAANLLNDPRHDLWVAIDGDTVIGFASTVVYLHPDKPAQLWINELGVAPSHHRRGIGKALMEAVKDQGRGLGCSEVWVLTEDDNAPARALYQSAGGEEATGIVMYTYPLNR